MYISKDLSRETLQARLAEKGYVFELSNIKKVSEILFEDKDFMFINSKEFHEKIKKINKKEELSDIDFSKVRNNNLLKKSFLVILLDELIDSDIFGMKSGLSIGEKFNTELEMDNIAAYKVSGFRIIAPIKSSSRESVLTRAYSNYIKGYLQESFKEQSLEKLENIIQGLIEQGKIPEYNIQKFNEFKRFIENKY